MVTVIASVERVSKRRIPVVRDERRPGDIPALIADSHRAQSRLDWRPRYDALDFIVKTALDWEARLEPAPVARVG